MDQRWYLNVNRFAKKTPWAHGFMTAYYQRLPHPVGVGLVLLGLIVVLGWWSARRHGGRQVAVVWTGLGALLAFGLSQLLASGLARPRPYQVLKGVEVLVPRIAGYGLPSGRAAIVGAAVAGLLLAARWRLAVLAALAGLLLLFSAIYVGVDYPSAVAAGAVFGAVVVLVLWPVASWLLAVVAGRLGAGRLARLAPARSSPRRPVVPYAVQTTSQRLPNARAMEALRAASEAARNGNYAPGEPHQELKA